MKFAILAAIGAATVGLMPSTAAAQIQRPLQFFNKCPVPVRYFIAIPQNGGWQTYGWFNASGNKPLHNLTDRYGNTIVLPEGTRLHYYAETTAQPSVRWAGNVSVMMGGANYATKPVVLSVRGGSFQFGLNCDKEINAGLVSGGAPADVPYSRVGQGAGPAGTGQTRPAWGVGKRVVCNFQRAGVYYPGRIGQVGSGGAIHIEYDDGDREWTTIGACRAG